jgi:hypothetical protein
MHLAAYRIATGSQTDPGTALSKAYDDVIGQKYDIGTGGLQPTMRVPKGMAADAAAATSAALQGLQPGDLRPEGGGGPGMTSADTQSAFLREVKSQGMWVPNKDDTGLSLMVPVRNSSTPIAVKRPDGSNVTVLFRDMPFAGKVAGAPSGTPLPMAQVDSSAVPMPVGP